jgi:hypothetical protein
MIDYKETARPIRSMLSQALPAVPPPAPDVLYTGYTGWSGFAEALTVITVSSAAAWVGIRTGLSEQQNPYARIAGWVGGVGSALIGLLYVGGKAGLTNWLPLPSVRIVPA